MPRVQYMWVNGTAACLTERGNSLGLMVTNMLEITTRYVYHDDNVGTIPCAGVGA